MVVFEATEVLVIDHLDFKIVPLLQLILQLSDLSHVDNDFFEVE